MITVTIQDNGKPSRVVELSNMELELSAQSLKLSGDIRNPPEPKDKAEACEAIIARVEVKRQQLGLNKSKFATGMGMTPQTYNNFVGQQGTKPSIDLLLGVVEVYGMDSTFLLTGKQKE